MGERDSKPTQVVVLNGLHGPVAPVTPVREDARAQHVDVVDELDVEVAKPQGAEARILMSVTSQHQGDV